MYKSSYTVFRAATEAGEGLKHITTIDSVDFVGDTRPQMSIQIPPELVQMFMGDRNMVRVVSYLYFDVEDFFPSGENK